MNVDVSVKAREKAMLHKSTGCSLRTSAVAQGETVEDTATYLYIKEVFVSPAKVP